MAINELHAIGDSTDFTGPVRGETRGMVCVELEPRQDLVRAAAERGHK